VLFSSGLLCFNARMLPYFRSVAIVGKYMDDSALQNMRDDLTHLVQYLQSQELHVCVEEQTARFIRHAGFELASLENIGHKADLVVVMGGDGTMLSVARALRDSNVCLIGINRGRLGFLTDLQTDNMLGELEKILQGEYQLESRMLLQSAVSREQAQLWQSVAMNDVVIKSACGWLVRFAPACRWPDPRHADRHYRLWPLSWRAYHAPRPARDLYRAYQPAYLELPAYHGAGRQRDRGDHSQRCRCPDQF
jgi:hypothetical protein